MVRTGATKANTAAPPPTARPSLVGRVGLLCGAFCGVGSVRTLPSLKAPQTRRPEAHQPCKHCHERPGEERTACGTLAGLYRLKFGFPKSSGSPVRWASIQLEVQAESVPLCSCCPACVLSCGAHLCNVVFLGAQGASIPAADVLRPAAVGWLLEASIAGMPGRFCRRRQFHRLAQRSCRQRILIAVQALVGRGDHQVGFSCVCDACGLAARGLVVYLPPECTVLRCFAFCRRLPYACGRGRGTRRSSSSRGRQAGRQQRSIAPWQPFSAVPPAAPS